MERNEELKMFDTITKKSHDYLQIQLDELKAYCDRDPAVADFVKYMIVYSDEMAYASNDASEDARIGREIIQMIWQISGMDFSNMANSYHFSPGWVSKLNNFIGNYFYDDSGFDFEQSEVWGTFKFKPAGCSANERWLQNPRVIVEAAKANRAYCKLYDDNPRTRAKVNNKAVMELVK